KRCEGSRRRTEASAAPAGRIMCPLRARPLPLRGRFSVRHEQDLVDALAVHIEDLEAAGRYREAVPDLGQALEAVQREAGDGLEVAFVAQPPQTQPVLELVDRIRAVDEP